MQPLYQDRRYALGELKHQDFLKQAEQHRLAQLAIQGAVTADTASPNQSGERYQLLVTHALAVVFGLLIVAGSSLLAVVWVG